jgi:glutathione S-transferase
MAETPTLYVCHGDDGGPRMHPCRRVQEALRANGIKYEKVIAAHGHPIPFLRKGSRDALSDATGDTKLPALKLPDGTIITHSRAILAWIAREAEPAAPVRASASSQTREPASRLDECSVSRKAQAARGTTTVGSR